MQSTENFAVKNSVFQYQDLVVRQWNPASTKQRMMLLFQQNHFDYQFIEYRHIYQNEIMLNCEPVFCCQGYFVQYILYKMYKCFYLFQGGFEVLKLHYFKHLCQKHIQNFLKHLRWNFLLKAVKSFQGKIHLRYLGSE